jgi:preprotein translocase subunit SecD
VNLWYGGQKKLKSISIGQVWRPDGAAAPVFTDDEPEAAISGQNKASARIQTAQNAIKNVAK